MPALHLYDVELEYSRSAMTSALECMVPTTNAALVLAYGRHYVHVATDRLRALRVECTIARGSEKCTAYRR
jgi:hypothetical protein